MRTGKYIISIVLIMTLVSCGISETEEVTRPGFLKIHIDYEAPETFENSVLVVSARNFVLYNGDYYTDVFQDPEQFLIDENVYVSFNLFGEIKTGGQDSLVIPGGSNIQVAYGSVPPGSYDRVLFQIAPLTDLEIGGEIFPIVSSNDELNVEIPDTLSSLVAIEDLIKIESDKITNIKIKFDATENVYRILDQFVFNTKVKSFSIENE